MNGLYVGIAELKARISLLSFRQTDWDIFEPEDQSRIVELRRLSSVTAEQIGSDGACRQSCHSDFEDWHDLPVRACRSGAGVNVFIHYEDRHRKSRGTGKSETSTNSILPQPPGH
jgi:hypothetical protein